MMAVKTLLITPPFTQLNTPYPATAYLSGFLNSKGLNVSQCDLSIELFTTIFSNQFLTQMFRSVDMRNVEFLKVWNLREIYIDRIDSVIDFLQNPDKSVAQDIIEEGYLPKGHRTKDISAAYNELDIIDQAKHLSTLFIEELGDFIQANIDDFFAFTKYAEQIATSASSFDVLEEYLQYEPTIIEYELLEILFNKIDIETPDLICFTIPFPGNLFSALRCAQLIKYDYPKIKIAFGGGYCNTELRSLSDTRIFNYVDFICLDDGEIPILKITEFLSGKIDINQLERTYILEGEKVKYQNSLPNTIVHHKDLPCPTYKGLPMEKYLSFLDIINPMHRLWTDGKWNKLTVSHGCYWKQCSFCDVHLDYIGVYQNTTATKFVDKMEVLIAETGFSGFHFVDEAAPPKALKSIAEEIIRRGLKVEWWTNIRFEKTFTPTLCGLLAKSGCIAVTGGLEVASDRLLKKMKKGVDIAQVARVTNAFSQHNIMVHAYLMYGFPTQTEQETIDALEVVRQLFHQNCIQSAFWHLFTATAHSPVGKNPSAFEIEIIGPKFEGFAQNDLVHLDPTGADHGKFGKGLNSALKQYMNQEGFEVNLSEYFEFEVPNVSIDQELVSKSIKK
jgi:radical SAM superfamily enzyme YgiQ (UPF0313 family)